MRLSDFHLDPEPSALEVAESMVRAGKNRRSDLVGRTTGIVSESVRLALRLRRVSAPAGKLLVQVAAGQPGRPPRITSEARMLLDVCSVRVTIDVAAALEFMTIAPVVAAARLAVDSARDFLGDGHQIIHELLDKTASQAPPCNHCFEKLTRIDRRSGIQLSVWLRGEIGCRFWVAVDRTFDEKREELILRESERVIYVEDDFPAARSGIRNNDFFVYDRAGQILAVVPLRGSSG